MSAKPDRKALLRKSIHTESVAVEQRFGPTDMQKRYADAEQALIGRPQGLVGPTVASRESGNTDFSAENAAGDRQNAVRQNLRIPIERAHDNPLNARRIYDPEIVRAMAASLATRGQLVMVPAIRHPTLDGHVILLDGHYRKRGLIAAGKTEIDVDLQEVASELDMYRISYLINEERNSQTTLDNALAWQKLLAESVVPDNESLAELTGMSTANVAKTLALLKLPEAAIDRIRDRPAKFGIALGYELVQCAKVLDEPALLELMDRVLVEDISSRALEAIRHKLSNDAPRKKKEVSRQYKIHANGQQIGFIKEWDSGKVTMEVHLPHDVDREALVASLKRRFTLEEPEPTAT